MARLILLPAVSISVYQQLFKNDLCSIVTFKKNKKLPSTGSCPVRAITLCVTILAFAMLMTGCKKFLELTPKEKFPQATLFADEQGFKDALIGVYIAMDKPTNGGLNGLYTNNLSMGLLSTLAFDYDNANISNAGVNGNFFASAVYYLYNETVSVKPEIDGIWGGMYNNIANINNLLSQIDGKKDVFTGTNLNRVKGEAIALRALFHFDLALS